MKWYYRKDIIDWINLIVKSDKDCEIILHDTSMVEATDFHRQVVVHSVHTKIH